MIKKYNDLSAYNADAKSTTESTVSFIGDGTGVKVDGVNVLTDSPDYGDMLFLDASNNIRWIRFGTLVLANLTGWTAVGVVYKRTNNKVYVLDKTQTSLKWAAVMDFTITGYQLDGVQHDCAFTGNGESGKTFSYNATTIDAFATQLNSFMQDTSNFSTDWFVNGNWQCKVADGAVKVYCYNYNNYRQYQLGLSGLTVTNNMGSEIPAISFITRKNRANSWAGCNLDRMVTVYSTSGRTPTANEGLKYTDAPVNLDSFTNSGYCDLLRSTYGDYRTYIDSLCAIYPYTRGALTLNDGKGYTAALGSVTFMGSDGTQQIKYPAANYCKNKNYDNSLLSAGKWYLPPASELFGIIKNITYGLSGITTSNCDKINQSLSAIGGNLLSCASNVWSSSRCNSYSAWSFSGSGNVHYNLSTSSSLGVRAVTLLKI